MAARSARCGARLQTLAGEFAKGARSFDPGVVLKTGATLVRQWRGHTHAVLVSGAARCASRFRRSRQNGRAYGKADEPRRRLPGGAPGHGRSRFQDQARLATCSARPGSPPTSRRAARSKTPRPWRRMRAPRRTKLYDRTADEIITLDEVERITI
jgi:hypothetical protein